MNNNFEWIPVSERLPEGPEYDWVLVKCTFVPEGGQTVPHIAELRDGIWYCDCCEGPMEEILSIKITHWFPTENILMPNNNKIKYDKLMSNIKKILERCRNIGNE